MSRGGICLPVIGSLLLSFAVPAPATLAMPSRVQAVRFDPGYYYNTGLPAEALAERLAAFWAEQGVNVVYFYAYSTAYGARYPTRYRYNQQEDFGRANLLGQVVLAAHRRGIKVIAWVYVLRHRGAWAAHPQWRSLGPKGEPYRAGFDQYFLSPHHPEVVRWWLGFVEDLLTAVPQIDGIDFAEPVVNWWGTEADHSEAAQEALARAFPGARAGDTAWRQLRARALSNVLLQSMRLAKQHGREVHVTTVLTPRSDGTLLSAGEVAAETGFDLEAVLDAPTRPDFINVETIYQQWAAAHVASGVFTPEWTARARESAKGQVRDRAGLIIHVELTPLAGARPTLPEFGRVLRALESDGETGIDIYDAHLLDSSDAWPVVRAFFTGSGD